MNSRAKGNRNERSAAKLLSTWTKRKFERTPSSGGLQWKASFSKGDVVCTKEGHVFPFCVEVKAHKEIDFSHLLNPKIKHVKVLEFWAQCKRDADKCNKVPLLMMRYDMMPKDFFFISIPYVLYRLLNYSCLDTSRIHYSSPLLGEGKDSIVFLRSTDFFKLPYKEIKPTIKKYLKEFTNGKKP